MSIITTAEELDALPTRTTVLNSREDAWQRRGNRWYVAGGTGGQRTVPYLPARVLDNPDQPTSTAPTVEQIAEAYFSVEPDGYPGRYAQVADRVKQRMRPRFEAIAALLPGRPESVVKAEALEEFSATVVPPIEVPTDLRRERYVRQDVRDEALRAAAALRGER